MRVAAVLSLILAVATAFMPSAAPRIARRSVAVQAEAPVSRTQFLQAAAAAALTGAPLAANAAKPPQLESFGMANKKKSNAAQTRKTGNAGSILKK